MKVRSRAPRNIDGYRRDRTSAAKGAGWARRVSLFAAGVIFLSGSPAQNTYNTQPPPHSIILPDANRLPDANDLMAMREQQEKTTAGSFAAANVERKKQIGEDTTRLFKLAMELKAEVDKTSKDSLSLNVIRKADEIERLARGVKEKMKLSIGAN